MTERLSIDARVVGLVVFTALLLVAMMVEPARVFLDWQGCFHHYTQSKLIYPDETESANFGCLGDQALSLDEGEYTYRVFSTGGTYGTFQFKLNNNE
jgi:hypothetical protein